jgi:type IV pilus assembly protein PilM
MAKESIVGLDIGSTNIKLVQLNKSNKGYDLVKAGMEEIGVNPNEKTKVEAIRKAAKKIKLTQKEVNISIDGPSVIIRNIQLPKMSEADLKNAIKYEAEKYIPYNIAEVNVDCQIMSEADNNMTVLLVAAKNDVINEKINLCQKAGLQPWIINIDSFALINAFNLKNDDSQHTIALLNIGHESTSVNIVRGDKLNFTRNVPVGGRRVTERVAEKLSVDVKEAHKLTTAPGDKKEAVDEVSTNIMHEMAIELKSSFDYYENQYEESVSKIYISGGMANNDNFSNFLSESMDLEVSRWSILDRVNVSNKSLKGTVDKIKDYLAVATGLALRKM